MRALVTGGAGFIGSALVRLLTGRGDAVLVLDKLTYAGHESSLDAVRGAPGFQFVRGDIADFAVTAQMLSAFRPEVVFHLAAESHVDRSITGADAFVDTNVVGTFRLLEAVRAYRDRLGAEDKAQLRFVHVSTDEVFGSLGETGAFSEETAYDPRSPYSASKAASDHFVRAWGHTYGLPVLVSNCSNNYGPRQLPEKLIPLTILNALECRPLPVYGDGAHVRDWLHVEDHAEALLLIAMQGRPQRTYAIGARNEQRNLAVVERICDLLDEMAPAGAPRRRLITFVEDRPGHDRRYAIDPARAEAELGWSARIPFADGLRRTVRWYLDNVAWWRPLRDAGHGTRRLGLLEDEPDA